MPPGLMRPIGMIRTAVVAGAPPVFVKLAAGGECPAIAVETCVGCLVVLSVEGGRQFVTAARVTALGALVLAVFLTSLAWCPPLQPPSIGVKTIAAINKV